MDCIALATNTDMRTTRLPGPFGVDKVYAK